MKTLTGSIFGAIVLSLVVADCAGVKPKQTGGTGGGGATEGTGGGAGIVAVDRPSFDVSINPTNPCGDGMLGPGKQCDDGNTMSGDGCSSDCQIEVGWTCPTPGQPCMRIAVCGDCIVEPPETCDDCTTSGTNGCSSTCQVEPGWRCPKAGQPCVPICGDGKLEGSETCDTGVANPTTDDGCSATCQVEPGWSCTGMPSVCTKSVCGNGIVEAGEACDCGTSDTSFPAGCTGPNGLFNGDGTGCSTTCTKEPVCRDTTGTCATHACNAVCGDGNVEPGEQCDDGNTVSGDGCSSTCQIETGWTCNNVQESDSVPCQQTPNMPGNCLELKLKYRDFKNESLSGGHPDSFWLGAFWGTTDPRYQLIAGVQGQTGSTPYTRRYCVPNSSGPARQHDSVARAWDIAQANLSCGGKPAFNTSRTGCGSGANAPFLADCQFTDFSHDSNGNHVPGYNTTPPASYEPAGLTCANYSPTCGLTYVSGTSGHPMYHGCAPVVTSAATFAQWWEDGTWESDGTTVGQHAIGNLELGPVTVNGATDYRYSSPQNSVYGGFFPMDSPLNGYPLYYTAAQLGVTNATNGLVNNGSPNGPGTVYAMPAPWDEPLLCNLWPYWYSPYQNSAVTTFGGGASCKSDQYLFPPSVSFATEPQGNWVTGMQGWYHDSYFSVEARYLFAFNGPFDLQFYGDDDTFVFINGILVVDLGGVHQRLPGKVSVDATGVATTQEGGDIYLPGETLPAGANVGDVIPCTGGVEPQTSVAFNSVGTGNCQAGETTCDCRVRTVDLGLTTGNTYEIAVFERDGHPSESNFQLTLSGFTTTLSQCSTLCGNGVVTGDKECDCGNGTVPVPANCPGPNNDTTYNGCTTMCTWGPYCGDGIVQNPPEQCDNGYANNNVSYSPVCGQGCTAQCTLPDCCGDGKVDADYGEQCDLCTENGTPGSPCSATCKLQICLDSPCPSQDGG